MVYEYERVADRWYPWWIIGFMITKIILSSTMQPSKRANFKNHYFGLTTAQIPYSIKLLRLKIFVDFVGLGMAEKNIAHEISSS